MAKKPVKPPIIGNLDEHNMVEKSRPLAFMASIPFVLGEIKILDTYLSRINARDPEATTVRFSKEEYEDLMGIERVHPERLNKYVKSMMSKVVTVKDPFKKGKINNYTLFEESVLDKDEDGQWWIDLTCTKTAKKLFFNIEKIGYIQYRLKNVLPLTSKYSVFLYIYLLDNRFRRTWTVDLQELRERWLYCTDPLYDEFKYFNQRILKKCIDEINNKTDLSFKYTPVRTGRKVTDIKFTLIRDDTVIPEPAASLPETERAFDKIEDDTEEQIDLVDVFEAAERAITEDYASDAAAELAQFNSTNNLIFDIPTQPLDKAEAMEQYRAALPDFSDEEIEYLLTFAYKVVPFEGNIPREMRIREYFESQYLYTKSKAKSPVGTKGFKSYLTTVIEEKAAKQEKKNR